MCYEYSPVLAGYSKHTIVNSTLACFSGGKNMGDPLPQIPPSPLSPPIPSHSFPFSQRHNLQSFLNKYILKNAVQLVGKVTQVEKNTRMKAIMLRGLEVRHHGFWNVIGMKLHAPMAR